MEKRKKEMLSFDGSALGPNVAGPTGNGVMLLDKTLRGNKWASHLGPRRVQMKKAQVDGPQSQRKW